MSDVLFRFEVELGQAIAQLKSQGLGCEAVEILAKQLQYELSCDTRERIYPHSQSLECIMRAVYAVLGNTEPIDRSQAGYIMEKLGIGVRGLTASLGHGRR